MEIFRLADTVRTMPGIPPALVSNRYLRDRRRALVEADRIWRALRCSCWTVRCVWTPVDRYGIVCLWRDHPTDPSVEIRIDKGGVGDVRRKDRDPCRYLL